MTKNQPIFLTLVALLLASMACSVLPGSGGAKATANAVLTQGAAAAATAAAQGNSLAATADAASTPALATANAAGAGQPTATTTGSGANSAAGPKDIPLMDPHTVISASDQEITYDTTADIQAAAQFYSDQMPKHGWTATGQPYVTASVAKLGFNNASSSVTVAISIDPKNKQTQVSVLVE